MDRCSHLQIWSCQLDTIDRLSDWCKWDRYYYIVDRQSYSHNSHWCMDRHQMSIFWWVSKMCRQHLNKLGSNKDKPHRNCKCYWDNIQLDRHYNTYCSGTWAQLMDTVSIYCWLCWCSWRCSWEKWHSLSVCWLSDQKSTHCYCWCWSSWCQNGNCHYELPLVLKLVKHCSNQPCKVGLRTGFV